MWKQIVLQTMPNAVLVVDEIEELHYTKIINHRTDFTQNK